MTRENAIAILEERGHDLVGATEIVDCLEETGDLDNMTKEEIIFHSINYYED